jgi:hypothetical protein
MEGIPIPIAIPGINLLFTESSYSGMQPHPPSVVVKFWDAEEGKWGMPHRLAGFAKRALNNRGAA